VSELQPNTSAHDSSLPEDSLLNDLAPRTREGLPASYRMRAETHYVDDLTERSAGPVIRMISTHAIQADRALGRADLDPLIKSIAAHGILQPLLVRGDGPPYTTVAGRNRLEAARLAGLSTVPCVILTGDGAQAEVLAQADNLRCRVAADPDGRSADAVDGFRHSLRRHMSTIQTAMTLSMGEDAVTRQVGFDLAHTHSYRAAWMVEAQQLSSALRFTAAARWRCRARSIR
jgi:ParB/RepB/Spo0J family partition protein